MLTNIIRTQGLVIKNTYFDKPPKNKATYRKVGTQLGPPWTPDRYEEIDHCIVRNSWNNNIINIQTEPTTNVSTDHFTMIATIRQKLKATDKNDYEINLKTLTSGQKPTHKETSTLTQSDTTKKFSTFLQIKTIKMWEPPLTQ